MSELYQSPEGDFDQPFTWVWNEPSTASPGQNIPNQAVDMSKKIGDFVLRRVAGLSNVLAPGTGLYQLRDAEGAVLDHDRTYVSSGSDELPIVPELFYPQTGVIRFDLYSIR